VVGLGQYEFKNEFFPPDQNVNCQNYPSQTPNGF
jgi:hypothetical protein